MKSHSEQEKKAAAQRQREEEERLAAMARLKAAEAERFEDYSEAEEFMIEPDNEKDEDWRWERFIHLFNQIYSKSNVPTVYFTITKGMTWM